MNSRHLLGHIVIAIFSLLATFFGVFNVLFSDTSGPGERAGAVVGILVLYFIVSFLFHKLWPVAGWSWVRWLVIPALLFGGFYLFQELNALTWYGLFVLTAVIVGSTLGRKLGQHRTQIPPVRSTSQ